MQLNRLVVNTVSSLAVAIGFATITGNKWIMTHQPMIYDRAKRRADCLALGTATGEADRDAHAGGQGSVQHLEQRCHGDRHSVRPAFAISYLMIVCL